MKRILFLLHKSTKKKIHKLTIWSYMKRRVWQFLAWKYRIFVVLVWEWYSFHVVPNTLKKQYQSDDAVPKTDHSNFSSHQDFCTFVHLIKIQFTSTSFRVHLGDFF